MAVNKRGRGEKKSQTGDSGEWIMRVDCHTRKVRRQGDFFLNGLLVARNCPLLVLAKWRYICCNI